MKIIVVDNYLPRRGELENLIRIVFEDAQISFFESIDVATLPILEPSLLVVHRNNPEYRSIVGSKDFKAYRIFFSGSYSGRFKKSEHEYHTNLKNLEKVLKEIEVHILS
ncbi:MAG: hypothetical protein HOG80_15870 [Candidatus Marinimicrobia bacterium]|jgi:hypothetical protein|nr:hypothetical protein [Candidatus Neomarinimicrobiota bacterium]